jgi:hypothetical protein
MLKPTVGIELDGLSANRLHAVLSTVCLLDGELSALWHCIS